MSYDTSIHTMNTFVHLADDPYLHPITPVVYTLQKLTDQGENQQKNYAMTKALGEIERCVRCYSKRHGFFDSLAGLFYRIWNATKAIFGQSDWQKGRRALKTLMVEAADHPVIKQLDASRIPTPEEIDQMKNFKAFLNNAISNNENGISNDNEELDQIIERFALDKETPLLNIATIEKYLTSLGEKISNEDLDKLLKAGIQINENKALAKLVNNKEVKYFICQLLPTLVNGLLNNREVAMQFFTDKRFAILHILGLTGFEHVMKETLNINKRILAETTDMDDRGQGDLFYNKIYAMPQIKPFVDFINNFKPETIPTLPDLSKFIL